MIRRVNNEESINKEARLLAKKMFGLCEISDVVVSKYRLANNILLYDAKIYQSKILGIDFDEFLFYGVCNSLDLCAVEYYVRLSDRNNVLTKKTKVMSYLLETECRSSRIFRSNSDTPLLCAIILLWFCGITAVMHFIKGWLLTRWILYKSSK